MGDTAMQSSLTEIVARRWGLSRRETQVLQELLAGRQSDKELSTHLKISEATARNHVDSIARKAGVSGRSGIISFCLKRLAEQLDELDGPYLLASGRPKALVVEDDADIGHGIVEALQESGMEASLVGPHELALDTLTADTCDVLICDLILGKVSGGDVLKQMAAHGAKAPALVLITGYPDKLGELEDDDRFAVLQKPVELADLVRVAWRGVAAVSVRRRLVAAF
jgi:DNA-binding NarL/FixJ family response regulator